MDRHPKHDERTSWDSVQKGKWAQELKSKIRPGDRVQAVWFDGIGFEPIQPGDVGIVTSISSTEVRVYFPQYKGQRFGTRKEPAVLLPYEVDFVGQPNPMEKHLREMVSG